MLLSVVKVKVIVSAPLLPTQSVYCAELNGAPPPVGVAVTTIVAEPAPFPMLSSPVVELIVIEPPVVLLVTVIPKV